MSLQEFFKLHNGLLSDRLVLSFFFTLLLHLFFLFIFLLFFLFLLIVVLDDNWFLSQDLLVLFSVLDVLRKVLVE